MTVWSKGTARRAKHGHKKNHYESDPPGYTPRFQYNPGRNVFQRILVSIGGKTRLASSQLIPIPYRWWVRWVLVAILALIAIFLTPQLMPKWIGFEWADATTVCEYPDEKLEVMRNHVEHMAKLPEADLFLDKARLAYQCMNLTALQTWHGREDVISYPGECNSANQREETSTETSCIPPQTKKACIDDWGLSVLCKSVTFDGKCVEFTSTDPDSVRQVTELNIERRIHQAGLQDDLDELREDQEEANEEIERVSGTADQEAQEMIQQLISHIDIASNLYIAYTMIAILIGAPVVIFKREVTSRIVTTLFGLQKAYFIILVVLILMIYENAVRIYADANFPRMFANFRNDQCYLDPTFSQRRLSIISDTCKAVTLDKYIIESTIVNMTTIFLDASFCSVCSPSPDIDPVPAPETLSVLNQERIYWEFGNETGYIFPAECNVTAIAEATATAEEQHESFAKTFLASGILAQILLKGILAAWITHLVAFLEPMTMHRGMVEIFGLPEKGTNALPPSAILSPSERRSVIRFARDKHIVPLFILSLLVLWEIAIIIYSAIESNKGSGDLRDILPTTLSVPEAPEWICEGGKLVAGGS